MPRWPRPPSATSTGARSGVGAVDPERPIRVKYSSNDIHNPDDNKDDSRVLEALEGLTSQEKLFLLMTLFSQIQSNPQKGLSYLVKNSRVLDEIIAIQEEVKTLLEKPDQLYAEQRDPFKDSTVNPGDIVYSSNLSITPKIEPKVEESRRQEEDRAPLQGTGVKMKWNEVLREENRKAGLKSLVDQGWRRGGGPGDGQRGISGNDPGDRDAKSANLKSGFETAPMMANYPLYPPGTLPPNRGYPPMPHQGGYQPVPVNYPHGLPSYIGHQPGLYQLPGGVHNPNSMMPMQGAVYHPGTLGAPNGMQPQSLPPGAPMPPNYSYQSLYVPPGSYLPPRNGNLPGQD